ncbi:hypothetical protein HYH03_002718 [Edaphochlamys debaryana]|uniref:Uncharacterized protein n=1 Tax=Edaphochlamys debaryana TaxID=47281 RepID=A0A836C3T0_9CHLO|nr:hypothetical protein HYH03_002718 [Edaphochlamys debaryana]|eukprot:KAG2499135.1 hypothetical protein HYH03_002718 [Edaphochlamys debaryana]
MSEEERASSLQHFPRHLLEGVFLAFCHWQAGSQPGICFQGLLALAPQLEQQLLDHVQAVLPHLSWELWAAQVQQVVADPYLGQQFAEQVMAEYAPARRLLF